MMGFYRKKPVVIEARHWSGGAVTAGPIIDWILDSGGTARYHSHGWSMRQDAYVPEGIRIDTLEGSITASEGDWIIKGVQGEFYPCKPDIFDQTYEEA